MKEHPILMKGPMARATLDGTKTQTRRPLFSDRMTKFLHAAADLGEIHPFWEGNAIYENDLGYVLGCCPYGTVGDRLWVRENYRVHKDYDQLGKAELIRQAMGGDVVGCIDYLATPRNDDFWGKRRPSILMPRWVCRSILEITEVRVQRLQEISEEDAIAEGIERIAAGVGKLEGSYSTPIALYAQLWDSTYGPDSWALNPWVWAISYKRL